jgi:NAD+ kinase
VVMPMDLVLVRHGQSEQNLVSHLTRMGDETLYTEAFRERHGSQHRLTPKGREQAVAAGEWLR